MNRRLWVGLVILGLMVTPEMYAQESSAYLNSLEQRLYELEQKFTEQEFQKEQLKVLLHDQQNQIIQQRRLLSQFEQDAYEGAVPSPKSMKSQIEEASGFEVGMGLTSVVQNAWDVNGRSSSGEDVLDASYSFDLELTKTFADKSVLFALVESADGAGVTNDLVAFAGPNDDAADDDSTVVISEFWYERMIFDERVTMTVGKIDATGYFDANEVANSETDQFLSTAFVNNPAWAAPDANPGIRFAFPLNENVTLQYLLVGEMDDFDETVTHVFGVDFATQFWNRPGNYRFFIWSNGLSHVEWDNPLHNQERKTGFGLSFDQQLSDHVTAFIRYGVQDAETYVDGDDYSIESSWSIGARFDGAIWGREQDHVGVAYGAITPSDDYVQATPGAKGEDEKHFEIYYSYVVNDYLTISPHLQVIMDAFGDDVADRDNTIVVVGARAQFVY